ncbi:hypothetical protein EON65_55280, partial [archaeon]
MRYKRASKALLRAEAQVLNRLPIELGDLEILIERMNDDWHIEKMLRSVCTILDNDPPTSYSHPSSSSASYQHEPNLSCLLSPVFNLEAHEFLVRLNRFRGAAPLRIDVQVSVRQKLKEGEYGHLTDSVSLFLLDWIELVLNATHSESNLSQSSEFKVRGSSGGEVG